MCGGGVADRDPQTETLRICRRHYTVETLTNKGNVNKLINISYRLSTDSKTHDLE